MRILDLFSGIGGFALAAQWVWGDDLDIVSFCEIDPFCQKVLKKHWPDVPCCCDIKIMFGGSHGKIDIITAGIPCQPFSLAGKRRGERDDRYLWPEVLRVIETAEPQWVCIKCVVGITDMALDTIINELENLSYTCESFDISACAVGLPTLERHIWIVASRKLLDLQGRGTKPIQDKSYLSWKFPRSYTRIPDRWNNPASRVCGVGERISNRVDRIKAIGNAFNPQVAEVIFRAIKEIDQ